MFCGKYRGRVYKKNPNTYSYLKSRVMRVQRSETYQFLNMGELPEKQWSATRHLKCFENQS